VQIMAISGKEQRMIIFIVAFGVLFVLASAAFGAWMFTAALP